MWHTATAFSLTWIIVLLSHQSRAVHSACVYPMHFVRFSRHWQMGKWHFSLLCGSFLEGYGPCRPPPKTFFGDRPPLPPLGLRPWRHWLWSYTVTQSLIGGWSRPLECWPMIKPILAESCVCEDSSAERNFEFYEFNNNKFTEFYAF